MPTFKTIYEFKDSRESTGTRMQISTEEEFAKITVGLHDVFLSKEQWVDLQYNVRLYWPPSEGVEDDRI